MGKRGFADANSSKKGKRDWKEVDERLIKRGEFYLSFEFLEKWEEELKRMNLGKRGRPFRFPGAFIEWAALVHVLFFMPYRQMEGFLKALTGLWRLTWPIIPLCIRGYNCSTLTC